MIDVRGELDQFISGISRMLGRNLIFPRLITQVSAGRRLLLPLEKNLLVSNGPYGDPKCFFNRFILDLRKGLSRKGVARMTAIAQRRVVRFPQDTLALRAHQWGASKESIHDFRRCMGGVEVEVAFDG